MTRWLLKFARAPCVVVVLGLLVLSAGCDRKPPAAHESSQTGGDESVAPRRPVSIMARAPATRPTQPLPDGASCVTEVCHTTYATSAQIHAPVAQNACDACHEADTGGHVYPLKRAGDDTCTFCHRVSGTLATQHKALEQGCQACHTPHVSATKFLLKSISAEALCATCHQTTLAKFAHRPFAAGQCLLCHQPHQSANPKLLRGGSVPEHCYSCHNDLRDAIATAGRVHEPAAKECLSCHTAHTGDQPALLNDRIEEVCLKCHADVEAHTRTAKVPHAAMSEERKCANCHDPHAANHRPMLVDRMDRTCLSCHDKPMTANDGRNIAGMKDVLTNSRFLHGAIKLGDCSTCHDAHGSDEHSLLTAAFPASSYTRFDEKKYELCFGSCHSPQLVLLPATSSLTNFRDGEKNLHHLHVNRDDKGRSCTTCHALHGSDLPNHMATEVPFEKSAWAMPIGFEKTDDGGSCAPGCHAPRAYRRGPATAPTTAAVTASLTANPTATGDRP